ncbi:MAG: hypothetical protein ACOY33_03145 [Pseudomonadota bacterium]
MSCADDELHRAKRELDELIARMRNTRRARAFFCYADAAIYVALQDLPREQWENPRVRTPADLELLHKPAAS